MIKKCKTIKKIRKIQKIKEVNQKIRKQTLNNHEVKVKRRKIRTIKNEINLIFEHMSEIF